MKACVLYGKGDLRLERRPMPEPGPGELRLALSHAGVCGSDIHYFREGRLGSAVITEPMVLGHEMAGIVDALGEGVDCLAPGDRVAVNPSHECGRCAWCSTGRQNLCPDLRYLGSAARNPHVQGIFQEFVIVREGQCVRLGPDLAMDKAACIEPLAIALHALSQGGQVLGARVFISGAGPVGCLLAAVARLAGAAEVCISDVQDYPLAVAGKLGADRCLRADRDDMSQLEGACEVVWEASGTMGGMASALQAVARGGTLVHVGFLPHEEAAYPVNNMVIRKELTVRGSLRAYHEFHDAARLLEQGRLDVAPLISAALPLERCAEALDLAADKSRSMKVLLTGGLS